MGERILMKGNEAMAEAAIRANCKLFFGYPITPSSEALEYMAAKLPEAGGCFLQAESEMAAIYMIYGAAAGGARAMTATSAPGLSLMQEGISYLVANQLPCLVINVCRAGPGLGRILPAQSDYKIVTKGGHGDCYTIALAPASVQELAEMTFLAFDLAEKWRSPVTILTDAMLGQLMEPVEWKDSMVSVPKPNDYAIGGAEGRPRRMLGAPRTDDEMIESNVLLSQKYERIREEEQRSEAYLLDDADIVVTAYGTSARISMEAVDEAREQGIKAGLLRPISVFPFPNKAFQAVAPKVKGFLCVEMNMGQMVDDVRLAVDGKAPVTFYGQGGGWTPSGQGVLEQILKLARSQNGVR